jgi:hypothetical protein
MCSIASDIRRVLRQCQRVHRTDGEAVTASGASSGGDCGQRWSADARPEPNGLRGTNIAARLTMHELSRQAVIGNHNTRWCLRLAEQD